MRPIDADALRDKLGQMWNIPKDWDGNMVQACEDAFTAIDDAPTIYGEVAASAYWIKDGDFLVCSNCESEIDIKNSLGMENKRNHCPCCGAQMILYVSKRKT